MRPFHHPNISQVSLEQLLYALSDQVRLEMVMRLQDGPCECAQVSFVEIAGRRLAKSTLSQHLKILREAGLVRSTRLGVRMRNELRTKELKEKFGNLVETILKNYRAHRQDFPEATCRG